MKWNNIPERNKQRPKLRGKRRAGMVYRKCRVQEVSLKQTFDVRLS